MSQNHSAQWDLGRFVKTLSYFGAIPFLSSVDWFQQWFGSRPDPKADSATVASTLTAAQHQTASAQSQGVVLVAGATGGVGKRVVQCLLDQGYAVRSLVRSGDRAKALLGEVPIVEADITLPETLTPLLMADVSAVICCTGTRVQPVEGDTPTREKYYQGVKFYRPEIVDTPEQVEYHGIQNLVQALNQVAPKGHSIFDFTQPNGNLAEIWGALDDVVMGGVSQSQIRFQDSAAVFSGTVSTANSGGFVSVRTRNFDRPINLSHYDGIELRIKGDGNRYKFMLRTQTQWDGVAHSASFDTIANQWLTIRLPFNQFAAVFRAKTVSDRPLDPSQIHAFQLMLSKFEYDGSLNPSFTAGTFQLDIESIRVYRQSELPQFVMVSSAGVTRPGRPDLDLANEPPAVRMNDQLGGILTWKLRGEAVVRRSGLPYTIIRPCALTENPGQQSLVVEQGDTLKGQVNRHDIAGLCVAAIAHPESRNLTFEVAEGQGTCEIGDWQCLFNQLNQDGGSYEF